MTTDIRTNRPSRRQQWMWLGLIVALVILSYQLSGLVANPVVLADDYVEYWAAGHLNLSGANPYAADQLLPLERLAGRKTEVLLMWNPPWTLALAMPLALFSYPISRLIWLIFSTVVVLFAINWTWTLLGGPAPKRGFASIIAIAFFPTIIVLRMGQIGHILLLGVVGFLYFEHKKQYWLAGAFAALLAIKPHLLFLVCISILFWGIDRRRWGILGGGALVLFSATLTAMMFNPHVITQYLSATVAASPLVWMTPTFGSLLRLLFGPGRTWMQFVPMGIGIFWLGLYWMRYRVDWLWADRISLLLLVSVVTAPFGWPFDQVVLIPAVMQTMIRVFATNCGRIIYGAIISYLAINISAFAIHARVDFQNLSPPLS
ncbi:glycosyltransferase family 87 protein [Candidatus Deferrimicrobium sp.]|uniref:glycosyltransferase family 87 protein n=1 Tax=Candidatus Deferrimicrobium sp. TaxID=3060586 RepID=UPI002ED4A39F